MQARRLVIFLPQDEYEYYYEACYAMTGLRFDDG